MSQQKLQANQFISTAGTTPQQGEKVLVTSSPVFGLKNKVINGNFDVWQRGTSFSPSVINVYTADRWITSFDGTAGTFTISQQTFTPGQTSVPNEPTYWLRYNQSVAGTGGTLRNIQTRIEDVRTFAGQTCTLSFWAQADTNGRQVTPSVIQQFNGSANVQTLGTACTLSTTWQKFTQTFSVPSITGKTLGFGNFLALTLYLPNNTTMTIDIAQVQLEAGSIDTAFETTHISETLRMCMRYCEVIPHQAIYIIGTCTVTTQQYDGIYNFCTRKRTTPSVPASAWSVGNCTTPSIGILGSMNVLYTSTGISGGGSGMSFVNNGIIVIDAEL